VYTFTATSDLHFAFDVRGGRFDVQIRQGCATVPCTSPSVMAVALTEPGLGVVQILGVSHVIVDATLFTALPLLLVDGTRIWVDVFGTIHVVMAVSGVCVDWTPATGRLTIDVPLVSLFVNRLGGLSGPLRNSTDGRLLVNGTDYSSRVWTFGLMSCVPADLRLLTIPPPLGWTSSCESIVPPFVDPPCSQVSTVCNTFLTPTPTTCVAGVTTLFFTICAPKRHAAAGFLLH